MLPRGQLVMPEIFLVVTTRGGYYWHLVGRVQLLLRNFSRVRLCATPQTAARQAPLSLGLSRQEHWSGLPLPSPMNESEK